MITTLLFDFYGVFQPDPYAHWLKKNNLQRIGIYEEIAGRHDLGLLTQTDFLAELSRASGLPVDFHSFYYDDNFNRELIDLVQRLKNNYKIGLLSNASLSLRQKLVRHQLDTLFDCIAISSEIGYRKPSKQAYLSALTMLGVSPHSTLFIDDSATQTQAASMLGMDTVIFTDVTALQLELTERNIE